MRFLLTVVLLLCGLSGFAQTAGLSTYADARKGYRLAYPFDWQVYQTDGQTAATVFYAGEEWRKAPASVTLTIRPLPAARKGQGPLNAGEPDSVRARIQRLPEGQALRIEPNDAGRFQEIRYDYTYTPPGTERTFVLGRRLWRDGLEYQLEYRAGAEQHPRYRAVGRQLLESFILIGQPRPAAAASPVVAPAPVNTNQPCDNKMYGIAALRVRNGIWEDDCRTIHEFSLTDPSAQPKIHRQALPFQSYALAKGFDNCLYSVTKSPTDAPEFVYRYDPATRQGSYTLWKLPAQGEENVWISAATDERGDLYFITSDGGLLVKVSPAQGSVKTLWKSDPIQKASYYSAVAFRGAGTHANFCIDDQETMWQVYSTDGSLLKIDLKSQRPAPELTPVDGLPKRGGYSDLLIQNEASGRRVLYMAGPKALYRVDLERRRATQVRRGSYTDLAGCNLFQKPDNRSNTTTPVAALVWRGRVLDALTRQPLPQASLRKRVGRSGTPTLVALTAEGAFGFVVEAGQPHTVQAQLPGYLPLDSVYTMRAGALTEDILLRPLAVGTTLQLRSVRFAQGQAVLLPSSFPELDQLLVALNANPGLTIELRGHTDNVGDPQKNVVLSQERVAAVKAYLVEHGVAEGRITGVGLGGTQPIASNAREATRQLNRRVEFRVTGVK